jgi:CRP/FNR family transcriptional regulator, cyclic AMP receptor protein
MDTALLLGSSPLFSHFNAEQLSALASCAHPLRLAVGTRVVKEGDASRDSFFIGSGHVRVQRDTPYGTFSLALLGPGDLFGETSYIDHDVRSMDAVAEEQVELLRLDSVALAALVREDSRLELALHWSFWKSLSQKLRTTNERLARFFTQTGKPLGVEAPEADQPTGSFRLDITQKRDLFQEQRLSRMEINFLASLSKERSYKPGEVLFREGDPGESMYIVLDGRVRIGKHIPGAGEEALAFMSRGDYFGEMALIDHAPRSAEATAHDQGAVVLEIPRDVLEGILDIRKLSSLRLLSILCSLVAKRLREIDEKLVGWFILAGGQGGALEG